MPLEPGWERAELARPVTLLIPKWPNKQLEQFGSAARPRPLNRGVRRRP
jgi:hypothetical protein